MLLNHFQMVGFVLTKVNKGIRECENLSLQKKLDHYKSKTIEKLDLLHFIFDAEFHL